MREFYSLILTLPKQKKSMPPVLKAWLARGAEIHPWLHEDLREAWIPVNDSSWREEVEEAKSRQEIIDWRLDRCGQRYSDAELAAAMLFRVIHTGRDLQIPMGKDDRFGLAHFVDVDTASACATCGAKAHQIGPLRVPGAELDKAGRFASIWAGGDAFFMIAESVSEQLAEACGQELPLRAVKPIGKVRPKESWWQLDPRMTVPVEAVRAVGYDLKKCPTCGVVRLAWPAGQPFGGYFTVIPGSLARTDLPPVVWSPFWDGDLERFLDGRVKFIPQQMLWLRGDAARVLKAMKIRGLDLYPIIEA